MRLEDAVLAGAGDHFATDLRLVPQGPVELGEAILLERLEREWAGRLVAGYLYIAAAGLVTTLHDGALGWGDAMLLLGLAAAALAWTPAMALEHAVRSAQKCLEDMIAATGRSAVDRSALFLGNVAVTFFYMPMMFLLVAFEAGFAYMIVRESIRMVLHFFPETFPPDESSVLSPAEVSQAAIGLLLAASVPLARRLAASVVEHRRAQAAMQAVEITQLATRLIEAAERTELP
jgi:hypothetical protein